MITIYDLHTRPSALDRQTKTFKTNPPAILWVSSRCPVDRHPSNPQLLLAQLGGETSPHRRRAAGHRATLR